MVPISVEKVEGKPPRAVQEPVAEMTTAAQLAQLNSTLDQVVGALIDIREVLKAVDARLNGLPKALADLQEK
jgi:hypothetical protein